MDAAALRFLQGLARVLDAVLAAIAVVVIVRLAVGERDQQLGARLHLVQQLRQMADGEAHARVILGADAADAPSQNVPLRR